MRRRLTPLPFVQRRARAATLTLALARILTLTLNPKPKPTRLLAPPPAPALARIEHVLELAEERLEVAGRVRGLRIALAPEAVHLGDAERPLDAHLAGC